MVRRYEFYFRVAKQYYIKFISSSRRVMFFLLYRHAETTFLMIFRRFPKIFQNCSEGQRNVPEHFPRISEDVRRLPKTFEEDPKMFR